MHKSTCKLFYIDNIIQRIKEYLIYENDLLKCNKYLYNSKLKYYKLRKKKSLKYIKDIHFKNLIHSKIINSKFQLSLNLYMSKKIKDKSFENLGNLHTLDVSYCNITDKGLEYLSKIQLNTLILSCCKKITDEGIKHLNKDKLHTLDITGCRKITDEGIKHLGNVKIITWLITYICM